MNKMNKIETYYAEKEALQARYDKATDEATKEACREAYKEWQARLAGEEPAVRYMIGLYSDMKQRDNSRLDISDTCNDPAEIIATFREYGVTEFTLSSTWSSLTKTAWEFTQHGYTVDGMVEINGTTIDFNTEKREKTVAFLFRA